MDKRAQNDMVYVSLNLPEVTKYFVESAIHHNLLTDGSLPLQNRKSFSGYLKSREKLILIENSQI